MMRVACTKQMRQLGLKGFLDKIGATYHKDLTLNGETLLISTHNLSFYVIAVINELCLYGGHTVLGETQGQICVRMKDE